MSEHFKETVLSPGWELPLEIRTLDIAVDVIFFESQRAVALQWAATCGEPQKREIYRLVALEAQTDDVRRALLLPGPLDHRIYGWPPEIVQRPTPYVHIYGLWNSGDTLFEAVEIESALARTRTWIAETYAAFGIALDQ